MKTLLKSNSLVLSILYIFLITNAVSFSSCGGGGGGGNSGATTTGGSPGNTSGNGGNQPSSSSSNGVMLQESNGSLNKNEVGGESLKVSTIYRESAPVDSSGNFKTLASSQGAQLILTTDSKSHLRAMAISIPNFNFDNLIIDATSTGVALVFMTPGICTADPTKAINRIQQIKSLASFASLLSFLQGYLPTVALSDLISQDSFNNLLETCIREWYSGVASSLISLEILTGSPKGGFSVSLMNKQNLSATIIQLSNSAWRYVQVDRRDLKDNVEQKVTNLTPIGPMGGAVPASWGSILTGTLGSPTNMATSVDFSSTTSQIVSQYWVRGPGFASGSDILPSSITDSPYDAWTASIIMYVLLPVVNLIVGVEKAIDQAVPAVETILNSVKGGISVVNFFSASDWRTQLREGINLTATILSLALTTGALVSLGFISSDAAAILSGMLIAGSLVMMPANMVIALINWSTLPPTAEVDITSTSGGGGSGSFSIKGQVSYHGAGVSGIFLHLGNDSTITDSNGYYSFTNLPSGSYTLTPATGYNATWYTFSPRQLTLSVTNADITGQNFSATSGGGSVCYGNLPIPNLVFTGTNDYTAGDGQAATAYNLSVTNDLDFPDGLFGPAPNLPPCGLNNNSSRAWVNIFDNNNNDIYGFCALTEAGLLYNSLWFGLLKGTTPPSSVYITITDRQCGITYTSTLATIH